MKQRQKKLMIKSEAKGSENFFFFVSQNEVKKICKRKWDTLSIRLGQFVSKIRN